jgi:hypothetical protein
MITQDIKSLTLRKDSVKYLESPQNKLHLHHVYITYLIGPKV